MKEMRLFFFYMDFENSEVMGHMILTNSLFNYICNMVV